MGIKTESFCKNIPPKEMTAGVDWLRILDGFDPAKLEQRFLNECARRNPYETCYRQDTPYSPVEERLKHAEFCVGSYRKDLEDCVNRIEKDGLTPLTYKQARATLIKAIGINGAAEYVRREYERLGEKGRREQAEEYRKWKENWDEQRELQEIESEYGYEEASVHEKIVRIRKGLKGSDGKPLTQRDFAKLIDYPINKYAEAEKIDRYGWETESEVDTELLDKLVMIAHANPYWLFDPECDADYSEYDLDHDAVKWGDEPCVYATVDVILRWIKEGRPRTTNWRDTRIASGRNTDGGFQEFCERCWEYKFNDVKEWRYGSGHVDCRCSVRLEFQVDNMKSAKMAIEKELKTNPFLSDEAIYTLFSKKLDELIDREMQDYIDADDYYEPVMEDFGDNCESAVEDFFAECGLELVSFYCDGDESEFEPDEWR